MVLLGLFWCYVWASCHGFDLVLLMVVLCLDLVLLGFLLLLVRWLLVACGCLRRVGVLWIRFACLILFVDLGVVIITVGSGFVGLVPCACLLV